MFEHLQFVLPYLPCHCCLAQIPTRRQNEHVRLCRHHRDQPLHQLQCHPHGCWTRAVPVFAAAKVKRGQMLLAQNLRNLHKTALTLLILTICSISDSGLPSILPVLACKDIKRQRSKNTHIHIQHTDGYLITIQKKRGKLPIVFAC